MIFFSPSVVFEANKTFCSFWGRKSQKTANFAKSELKNVDVVQGRLGDGSGAARGWLGGGSGAARGLLGGGSGRLGGGSGTARGNLRVFFFVKTVKMPFFQ